MRPQPSLPPRKPRSLVSSTGAETGASMAERVLGATVQAEAAERGCFSPSVAAGLPAPLRQDAAATSIEGTARGLHRHARALCVPANPRRPQPRLGKPPAWRGHHQPHRSCPACRRRQASGRGSTRRERI